MASRDLRPPRQVGELRPLFWAVARKHVPSRTAPATRWAGPSGPLDQDRRWAGARRLLHDGTCPPADRVAGLLVLLYAQKLSVVTALTTRHV